MFINAFEFDMISNEYKYKDGKVFGDHALGFINGAWYAYQEQQKRIDAALEHINKKCDEFCETHDMDNVALLEEVEDLLK